MEFRTNEQCYIAQTWQKLTTVAGPLILFTCPPPPPPPPPPGGGFWGKTQKEKWGVAFFLFFMLPPPPPFTQWRSGIGGQCQRESRSCTGNRQQENYVVTQYIQAEGALEILIQLGYRFTSCSKNNCALDVLIYETCEEGGDEDPNNYRKLFTVTASSSSVSSLERQFSPTNIACGFYLALRENGTCVSIYYMALYSYQCPSKTSNLVNYPTTDSPAQDSENPVETTGTCSNYSSQDDGETLNPALNCGQEGQWTNEPSCYCNPGYWHDPASDTCNRKFAIGMTTAHNTLVGYIFTLDKAIINL